MKSAVKDTENLYFYKKIHINFESESIKIIYCVFLNNPIIVVKLIFDHNILLQ